MSLPRIDKLDFERNSRTVAFKDQPINDIHYKLYMRDGKNVTPEVIVNCRRAAEWKHKKLVPNTQRTWQQQQALWLQGLMSPTATKLTPT